MKKQIVIKGALAAGIMGVMALPVTQAQTVVDATVANGNWDAGTSGYPSFWTSNFSTTDDVLLGLSPTSTAGDFTAGGATSRASVTDGVLTTIPSNNNNLSMFQSVGTSAGTELTYALSQPSYLSAIQYYGGWTDNGRCSINFTVAYSTDNGATYTTLYDPTGGYYVTTGDPADTQTGGMSSSATTFGRQLGGLGPVANYVSVTDASGYLGGGAAITDLEFTFGSVPNGWSGLEQIVADGVPVPEPGTWALLSGGLLSLLAVRKRKAA